MSKQPRDDANAPIPVLGYRPNGGQTVSISGVSSTSNSFRDDVRVVTLYSTIDAFFEVGDVANTSNSHFIPAGYPYDVSLGSENRSADNARTVSVVSTGSAGILYISERI